MLASLHQCPENGMCTWYPKTVLTKHGVTGDPCTHDIPSSVKLGKKLEAGFINDV